MAWTRSSASKRASNRWRSREPSPLGAELLALRADHGSQLRQVGRSGLVGKAQELSRLSRAGLESALKLLSEGAGEDLRVSGRGAHRVVP